jgi:hypothetical protein
MNEKNTKKVRVLAVAPTSRGFGYVVLEGQSEILAFGCKKARGDKKNQQVLVQVGKLADQWLPDVLALQDFHAKGSRRPPRIRKLHRQLLEFGESRKVKMVQFSGHQLRESLVNDPKGTRHEMASEIARQFPNELAEKLPPKRRACDEEDERMSIFDAAALAVVYSMRCRGEGSPTILPISDSQSAGLHDSNSQSTSGLPIRPNHQ